MIVIRILHTHGLEVKIGVSFGCTTGVLGTTYGLNARARSGQSKSQKNVRLTVIPSCLIDKRLIHD
jgi:hypothetical protein